MEFLHTPEDVQGVMSGEDIMQVYFESPYLLHNHKSEVALYWMLVSIDPLVVYYFDDELFTNQSRSLQENTYKVKYSCSTNNITYFGSISNQWKFTSKIVDAAVPAHYISTYKFKQYKITFECIRFSELSKRELMKELCVSYIL